MPNILGSLVVVATLGVAGAIIAGAALSFLGLGAKPPTPEWGLILSEGRGYLRHAWWITTFPGLAIMVTVLSINLLGRWSARRPRAAHDSLIVCTLPT